MDIFNVGAAEKIESYEVCAYESLIRQAKLMKHTKAERLLNQNLKEEQQTLKKMQSFSKKLKPENVGMEEESGEHMERSPGARKPATSRRSSGRRAA